MGTAKSEERKGLQGSSMPVGLRTTVDEKGDEES